MQSIENETWGPVSTLRVKFSDGFEVEFNFSDLLWAKTDPIDTGTFTVVAGGAKVLYDPLGLLEKLLKEVALSK